MRSAGLPAAHGLAGDADGLGELLLREAGALPEGLYSFVQIHHLSSFPAPSIAENSAARQRAGFTYLQTLLYTGAARTLHRRALTPHPCCIRVTSALHPRRSHATSALHPHCIPALRPRRSGSRGRARSGYSAGARGRPQSWRAGGICRPSPCSRPRGCRPRRGRRGGCARRRGRRCP